MNLKWDAALRMHQTLPFFNDSAVFNAHDVKFGDAVADCANAGGSEIDNSEFVKKSMVWF